MKLIPITQEHHLLITRLYALYLHDLSEFGDGYHLDEQGQWQPDYLPYWLDADQPVHPLLLQDKGRYVGFAFVGEKPFPYMNRERDYRLSEFFIARPYRREGLGRAAAFAVFDRFPGVWEVVELPGNKPAVGFWQKTIDAYTSGNYRETMEEDGLTQVFKSVA
ncbi:MAG: GNAT family N-acetyltransferase [Acidobacteriota bacterium]|nr:GNAT family N-acetyltransferase [Acidobacteriota bacterium]